MVVNAYIRKETSLIGDFSFYLKKLNKKSKLNPKEGEERK